jgi:hypothetical protein
VEANMNTTKFWQLIDAARSKSVGDCEEMAEILQGLLEEFSPEEIVMFYKIFIELDRLAYNNELRAAAYIINGSGSEDGFTDFRAWLISRGEKVFSKAIENPETLVDIDIEPEFGAECEQFAYTPLYAYEEKTGQDMPLIDQEPVEIVGKDWKYEDLKTQYPNLWAKFVK